MVCMCVCCDARSNKSSFRAPEGKSQSLFYASEASDRDQGQARGSSTPGRSHDSRENVRAAKNLFSSLFIFYDEILCGARCVCFQTHSQFGVPTFFCLISSSSLRRIKSVKGKGMTMAPFFFAGSS